MHVASAAGSFPPVWATRPWLTRATVASDAAAGVPATVVAAAVDGAVDVVVVASVVGAGASGVVEVVVAPLLEHAPRTNAATMPRSGSRRIGMQISLGRVLTFEVSAEAPAQARVIRRRADRILTGPGGNPVRALPNEGEPPSLTVHIR